MPSESQGVQNRLFPQHTALYHLHNWILIFLRRNLTAQFPNASARTSFLLLQMLNPQEAWSCQCQGSTLRFVSSSPPQPVHQCGGHISFSVSLYLYLSISRRTEKINIFVSLLCLKFSPILRLRYLRMHNTKNTI